jgi:hypothetical protein
MAGPARLSPAATAPGRSAAAPPVGGKAAEAWVPGRPAAGSTTARRSGQSHSGSVATRRAARSSAVTQAAQAQLRSKTPARRAPSLACTTEAVAGLR